MFVVIGGLLALVMGFREVMLTSSSKLARCWGGGFLTQPKEEEKIKNGSMIRIG